MRPLRLAVDARVIAEDARGIGRYARAVLRRFAVRDDVALTLLADGPFARRARAGYARALGSDRFAVASRVPRDAEVVWHPANGTFFASSPPARSVATIHDAVPFRFPLADVRRREHAQAPFLRSARDASAVIAVSRFGAAELRELLGVSDDHIAVIPHGVDGSFTPGEAEPLPAPLRGKRFLLFVGDPIGEPRKNFPLLYEAYRRAFLLPDSLDAVPLLAVAGPRAPASPGVVHVGELFDDVAAGSGLPNGGDALRACYRGALALALASYHETFGMPLLEAMACGTPVVASRAGSLPEVAGEAALFAPPDDADAWADALRRVVDDEALRARLREDGLQRASQFSWEESAQRHFDLFRAVAT